MPRAPPIGVHLPADPVRVRKMHGWASARAYAPGRGSAAAAGALGQRHQTRNPPRGISPVEPALRNQLRGTTLAKSER